MSFRHTKGIWVLSIAFFFIFSGFNAVQQYITAFFSQNKVPQTGYYSLILIYSLFTLSDPFSAFFVSHFGAKRSMAIGAIFYGVFILTLITRVQVLIYLASALLGSAASLLWTGQTSYLAQVSNGNTRGINAGFFSTFFSLGSALGVLMLGFFISHISYTVSFFLVALLPLTGFLILLALPETQTQLRTSNHWQLLKLAITSKTALQLSLIWYAFSFAYGLAISIIPIEVKNTFRISSIGSLFFVFYLMPILLSYFFGKLSDRKGRKTVLTAVFIISILGLGCLYASQAPISIVGGITLFAIGYSSFLPITLALIGDVSNEKNLNFLTALFWMIQNLGVVSSLILASFIHSSIVYAVSIAILLIVFLIVMPLLRVNVTVLRKRLSREVG